MATRIRIGARRYGKKRLEPRKQPVQTRSRATVEVVLEAAAQVFERCGYAGGTTNRIAERAGVSIGTLYQYFPNQEALAVALLERHLEEGLRLLGEWTGRTLAGPRSLRETLALFVEGMIALHGERPRLQHVLFEETPLSPRLHEALLAAEREEASRVAWLLSRYPEVRHPRLEEAASMAVQTVESLTHRFAAHPEQMPARTAFGAELVSMLEAYLKTAERPVAGGSPRGGPLGDENPDVGQGSRARGSGAGGRPTVSKQGGRS